MLQYSATKVAMVLAITILGFVFASPNLMNKDTLAMLPSWAQGVLKPMPLGLDLQGGSYLLLEVDLDAVYKEQLTDMEETVRATLREPRIGFRNLRASDEGVFVSINEAAQVATARDLIVKALPGLTVDTQDDNRLHISVPDKVKKDREIAALNQSIEIVRRRIDEFGTSESSIQRQGLDRIIVELPGVDQPERVKGLLGQTAKLNFHLLEPNVGPSTNPRDMPPGTLLLPGGKDDPQTYAVRRRVEVSGERLVDAQASFQEGRPVVNFRFDTAGGRRFGAVTAASVGQRLAIVLDNKVISAPYIKTAITGGSGYIEGGFTVQGAQDLALLLRAGALPAPLIILEERSVGPGLGADSIADGERASILGVILVVVFMILSYFTFGVFAVLALLVNVVLLFALMSAIGATLTLPGIAGVVLTLGMAVDANVLIYERMREEFAAGRTLLNSLGSGFNQAFLTIFDSNVTMLIAGGLLFVLGSGPVKGFAVTLVLGLFTSIFSAVMVTRLLVWAWFRMGKRTTLPIDTSQERKGLQPVIALLPREFNLDFIRVRNYADFFSMILVVGSLISLSVQGLNFGIDFAGGVLVEARAKESLDLAPLRDKLNNLGVGDVAMTTFGEGGRDIMIRVQQQEGGDQAQTEALKKVQSLLGEGYEIRRTEVVGPKVGSELIIDGALAIALAIIGIAVYVWIRFEWQFALGACLSLTHDVITTIGIFSIFQLQFDLNVVAAVLTVAGVSINDTVVVYDRVREMLRKYKKLSLPDLLNLSLNKVLARTMLTNVTASLAVIALVAIGGPTLQGFSLAMLWGMFIGSYSTVFMALPVLVYFNLRREEFTNTQPGRTADKVPEYERQPT